MQIKINLLCNSDLAIPAIYELASIGILTSIGLTRSEGEDSFFIQQTAKHYKIPVSIFTKKSFESELSAWLKKFPVDAVFVMTFPYKIPKSSLIIPRKGFFNFHYGLLPGYRSAEPIFWQIRNREKFVGITVHKMDENWDTGPILLKKQIPLNPNETHGMHWNNLAQLGGAITPTVIGLLEKDKPSLQVQEKGKYRKRPIYDDVKIDWQTQNSKDIIALIKACNPWNKGAFTLLNENEIRIVDVKLSNFQQNGSQVKPGSIEITNNSILIQCKDNYYIEPLIFYSSEGFFTSKHLLTMGVNSFSIFT
jgi:methionyl-tRNA formyltransferase